MTFTARMPELLKSGLALLFLPVVFSAPPREFLLPAMQFDIYHIKTPQLIGIFAGVLVFTVTIGVVFYLLYASGTLGAAWKEIVQDAGLNKSLLPNEPKQSRLTTPFSSQPELYDHLIEAKKSLPINFDLKLVSGVNVNIRTVSTADHTWLFEASNGTAQYQESAYDLARVWGWHDVNIGVQQSSIDLRQPWKSNEAFVSFLQQESEQGILHVVIEDKEYKKPIGLISLSNYCVRNLSVNIGESLSM
jgi:hypothetical protein